jgi:1-acyl-sn-glycerol-3-phosphate acyltransferase
MLRTLFIACSLSLYILLLGPPLVLFTIATGDPDPLYWTAIRGIIFFMRLVNVRIQIVGRERIPAETCLFAANHTSSADAPAVVWAIPRRIAILLKETLFRWPIVGQAFRAARFIPVDRRQREAALESMDKAIDSLRAGQSFLVYPEGTRSPDGRLQSFKKGAAVMAIKAGVPIVPVACSGAHRIMEKRSLIIHPGRILVEFLQPIDPSSYSLETRDALNQRLHDEMAAGLPPDQRPLDFPGAESAS